MEIFEKIGLVKVLEVGDERAHYDWDTTSSFPYPLHSLQQGRGYDGH